MTGILERLLATPLHRVELLAGYLLDFGALAAVQHLPALVLPQFLLCGLFAPLAMMLAPLGFVARAMPMTYAVDAGVRAARQAHPSVALTGNLRRRGRGTWLPPGSGAVRWVRWRGPGSGVAKGSETGC
ncbi:hypothetical protein ACFVFQ_06215 [Streptomyces sp. NPDC057743]|uniref:hypothetical protein n=1 Tax=Streptomyces sp. NPDC057743 TaxID=3346236 RepID=UPI0036BAA5BE